MSSSTFIMEILKEHTELIKDVERNKFVFSDGCGFISPELMKKVQEIFKLEKVSAIQMRYAGYKGVLVVHQALASQPCIQFRESMKSSMEN